MLKPVYAIRGMQAMALGFGLRLLLQVVVAVAHERQRYTCAHDGGAPRLSARHTATVRP